VKQLPPGMRTALRDIATQQKRPLEEVLVVAQKDLAELDSHRGRIGSWGFAALSRFVRRLGFRHAPIYDLDELEQLRQEVQSGSVVFLVTHKTYLDFFVLFEFFYRNNIQPPRIFGGANMAFAGFGLLARHSGGIFIRRSFRDDPVYKAVLSQHIADLLVQKESFMWAIEGTRSRTGKLLIPKLGLLNYVTAAARPLGEKAVSFVPVAVVYDRIPDVADMAAQEAGARKQKESLSWFFGYLRKLSGNFGDIHIRFGAPIVPGDTPDAPDLGVSSSEHAPGIEVQKLAFEACFRINEITPATMNSLVLLSLLCRGPSTLARVQRDTRELQSAILKLHPGAWQTKPSRPAANDPAACINDLVTAGLLHRSKSAAVEILQIKPQALSEALYYSNMAAHHLVIPAFTELSLASMFLRSMDFTKDCFESETLALRELFKFEFFFSRKETFHQQLQQELLNLGLPDPVPDSLGYESLHPYLGNKRIRVAIGVLVPYIGAYRAVVEQLLADPANAGLSEADLIARCLETARVAPVVASNMFRPGLSRALLANGLRVLDSRRLRCSPDDAGLGERQRLFLAELDRVEQALEFLATMNAPLPGE